MDESPSVFSYLATLLRDEIVVYGVRYLIGLGIAVIGLLLFGPGYKRRIAVLEAELAELKKYPPTKETDGAATGMDGGGSVSPSKSEERVYTARTAGEFFAAVGNMTNLEIDNLIQPHLGKWLRVQNVINNIVPGDGYFVVTLGPKFSQMPYLRFARSDANSVIETMKRGDRIAVEGRIVGLNHMMLEMDCCEIVALQEKDDVLRLPKPPTPGTPAA